MTCDVSAEESEVAKGTGYVKVEVTYIVSYVEQLYILPVLSVAHGFCFASGALRILLLSGCEAYTLLVEPSGSR